YKWYEALEDSELKDLALRNKAVMEGSINDDDDESRYEQKRQWNMSHPQMGPGQNTCPEA
ncbi:hypothetical protein Tco_0457107, partial [Tanacetum coccineum]